LVLATVAVLLSACGSQQLPRPLSPAERMEVQATTIPAVVGVQPSMGEEHEENLRRILDESGLFQRVALARDLDEPPDLAVVLTGAGSDGAQGALAIRAAGGTVLAQDEATSAAWGMPGAATRAGAVEAVASLSDLPAEIDKRRHGKR